MTVAELAKTLSRLPQDMNIFVAGPGQEEIEPLQIDCVTQVAWPCLSKGDVCLIYTDATRP